MKTRGGVRIFGQNGRNRLATYAIHDFTVHLCNEGDKKSLKTGHGNLRNTLY